MSTFEEATAPPRVGRTVFKRAALAALLIVLATAGAVSTAVILEVQDDIQRILPTGANRIDSPFLADVPKGGPQTILLLGSDRRFADISAKRPARSDTIILLRLDPSRGVTSVMSVPRDLKVQIPTKDGPVTDKVNAAFEIGGPSLTVRTLRDVLGIPINHVVNVNFGGFRRAVDRLGCVYADVDRRYFNDNSPPYGGGPDYATIDISPGYQKLCGSDALDYVRYRHFDNDLIRSARQQDFLRQAKDQFGIGKLFGSRKALLSIFGEYTITDIADERAILRLVKLAYEASKNPIQEIHFRSEIGPSYVTATPGQIRQTVREFTTARGSSGPRGKPRPRASDAQRSRRERRRQPSSSRFPGLFDNARIAEDQAIVVGARVGFPVYYPTLASLGSSYVADAKTPRAYTIADRGGHHYRAYRLVVAARGNGQYYGIQGTSWKAPPILDNPSETVDMRGRKYQLFYDGNRLRLVAWRTPKAVYWVSNTLLQTLSNAQMRGIARSLQRVGG